MSTLATPVPHPAWCGGCTQLSAGTEHVGIGYPVTVDGTNGNVTPIITATGERIVDVNVLGGHLTPSEARQFARALETIAAMVEEAGR